MAQFNIRNLPDMTGQQINDLQGWLGTTKTQAVLLAVERLWYEERNKRRPCPDCGEIMIYYPPNQWICDCDE